jgi:hypothetical protein
MKFFEDVDKKTFAGFAQRSDVAVFTIALFFALAGGLAIISGDSLLWGMWIPLCFITIPPIHYLCREVVSLRQKIEQLEKKSG